MASKKIHALAQDNDGKLPAYAWPGGYPLYYVAADNGVFCPKCANENIDLCLDDESSNDWKLVEYDANYEDCTLMCENCNEYIDPAYVDGAELQSKRLG